MKISLKKHVSIIHLLTLILVIAMSLWWLFFGLEWFINFNNPNPPLAPDVQNFNIEDQPFVDDTEKPLQIVEIKKSI